ncbi:hypothetical protein [Paraburkholderia sp. MM6662-R1]|uniref:hypothetical protein n=1 Tax=Paraburkholderia sp. MM6662-R1 TaxID=2991066 RepID=UPI003D1C7B1E
MRATIALGRIDDGIGETLRGEIRTLVDAKYLVDALAHERAGQRLTGAFHDGPRGPRHGGEIFRAILPFAGIEHDGEAFSALVPTAQTIGASWRWHTGSVSENEREDLLAFFQSPERATPRARERAEYFWIKPLGLFLADEGKNRVGFLRDMKVDWIPARVFPCGYVAPERLTLYRLGPLERPSWWAVLDGTWLEPLMHPAWALPILRAYGVRETSDWPTAFPSIQVTRAALRERSPDQVSSFMPALNLQLVLEKHAYQNEVISSSLFGIDGITVQWRFVVGMMVCSIAAVVLIGAVPSTWDSFRIAASMAAGAGIGPMLASMLSIWKLPRQVVDPFAVHRKFGPLERVQRRRTHSA